MESGLLEAYRTLGLICDDKAFKFHREGSSSYISLPIGSSFLTYNIESLKIRYTGCQLEQTVNSLDTYKDLILLASGNTVSAFHKVKMVKLFTGCTSAISEILVFGEYLLGLTCSAELKVWDCETTDLLNTVSLPSEGLHILHPPTYLNKVLVGLKKSKIILINVKTSQKIYEFPNITQSFDSEITALENAVALDVVGIGLETGKIIFANLLKDEVLFSFEQTGSVTSLSVCSQPGLEIMATGNNSGSMFIWDLKNRKIQAKVKAHSGFRVSKVFFTPGESLITSSSGGDNSIKQWIFDFESPDPRLYKNRVGFNDSPSFLRFYNQNNIVACSNNSIRDLSVLNEHQSTEFSSKHAKKTIKRNHINFKIPEFTSFSCSSAKERDWHSVISCNDTEAFLWNYENKVIGDKAIERMVATKGKSRNSAKKQCAVTSSSVSPCGNFGVLGLESGEIEKFNMQSGFHQFVFKGSHSGAVCGIEIDITSSTMFSASTDGELLFWDFFTGKLLNSLHLLPIRGIKLQKSSSLLGVFHESQTDIYDVRSLKLARTFPGEQIRDISFSFDSRWIGVCDKTGIKVWDIPSARIIDWVTFKNPAVCLDFSLDGRYLATTHEKSYGVFLWLNKSYYTSYIINKTIAQPRKIKGFDVVKGKNFYSRKVVKVKELVAKELDSAIEGVVPQKLPKAIEHGTFKNSELAYNRILALYHLDEIKERNAPVQPPKKPEKVPFFLPDSLGIVSADGLLQQEPDKKTEETMLVEKDLSVILENSSESIVEFLKSLAPGKVELNLYGLIDDDIPKFIEFLYDAIKMKKDFDFIQSVLSCFLKIHSDKITKENAKELAELQSKIWGEIESLFIFDISGLERLID